MAKQPRWIKALNHAWAQPSNKHQNVYQIATVDSHNIPHVRTLVHRAMIFPKDSPSLPIFLTTTDIRTPKVTQILSNPTIEVVLWLEGTKEQYRFLGRASIVPSSSNALHDINAFPRGSALAKLSEVGEVGGESGKYDWEAKRKETFNSMSPYMRASWARPVPGSPIKSYEEAKTWPNEIGKLGEAETEEEKKHEGTALENFALVLIEPTEVDWIELGVVPNQRTKFTRKVAEGEGDEWDEVILVP